MAPAGKQTNVNANVNAARLGGLDCRSAAHASWLANVLDRESCELIVTKQSPLFEQDLAVLIKRHFTDVLSQLQGQREATDPEHEEE